MAQGDPGAERREMEVSRLCAVFDDWKEVIVLAKNVLDWEEQFHPFVVGGSVTLAFLLVWWVEPTLLSLVSFVLLLLTLADFLLPQIRHKIFAPEDWNADREQSYADAFRGVVDLGQRARALITEAKALKADRPRLYLALTVTGLLLVAWIGSALGDLTLLYLIIMGIALYPGAIKCPTVRENVDNAKSKIYGFLGKRKDE